MSAYLNYLTTVTITSDTIAVVTIMIDIIR